VNDCVNRIYLATNSFGCRKWVLDADISLCFDSIGHEPLIEKLKQFPFKAAIKQWLGSGISLNDVWYATEEGTPQGGVLSPLLCNIALHGLEEEMGVKYTSQGVSSKGRLLLRFADDMVVLCHTHDDAQLAKQELSICLEKRGLALSEAKTRISHICEGFDFLGFNFRIRPKDGWTVDQTITKMVKEDGSVDYSYDYDHTGMFVYPSDKSIGNIKTKIKEAFTKSHGKSASYLIDQVNPIIRGWAQSKRCWHSNRVFHDLDNYLFDLQVRWAKRQHPNKAWWWIKGRYFKTLKLGPINNRWVFTDPDKKTYMLLFKWFPIKRHILAQMTRNPDNFEDTRYYQELTEKRGMLAGFNTFRKMDNMLAVSQLNICPVCEGDLFNGEQLHIHHIIERQYGGQSSFKNLVLLHLPCHYRIHSGTDKDKWAKTLNHYKTTVFKKVKVEPRSIEPYTEEPN